MQRHVVLASCFTFKALLHNEHESRLELRAVVVSIMAHCLAEESMSDGVVSTTLSRVVIELRQVAVKDSVCNSLVNCLFTRVCTYMCQRFVVLFGVYLRECIL